ncbi:MAG: GtrA family protein [Deltaproteobacteria bacterium]|nr:GtrA family protein [Deltaproteobacteria bacterium]
MSSNEASPTRSSVPRALAPFLSRRFLKFAAVGLSGVVVNLGFLAVFADLFEIHANVSSALAIELSILSNFMINELWTFRDRTTEGRAMGRMARFHLVALVGASAQWTVFVFGNLLLFSFLGTNPEQWLAGAPEGFFDRYILRAIYRPPDTGHLKYLAQFAGIGVSMSWNFLANFHWTWRAGNSSSA